MVTIIELFGNFTPQHRLARYLVKMARNINNPIWKKDKAVLEVLTEGILDKSKVREKFIRQNIMSGKQFDEAEKFLRDNGFLEDGVFWREKTSDIEIITNQIDTETIAIKEEEEAELIANQMMKLPKVERDENKMSSVYSDKVREKIANKEFLDHGSTK